MKISLFLISIFLICIIDVASLKKLTDILKMVKDDNMKNDELIINKIYGNRNDDEVSELNKLKFIKEETELKDENPENSLKKLRNSNLKGSKFLKNTKLDKIDNEYTPTHEKSYFEKENLENLSIPNEITESTTENNKVPNLSKNETFINPYKMLRDSNGKYSAYEIAHYIFFTGDETGIANAVEELINEGLMNRENAVEFLNDIRLGIDFLENKYKNGENRKVLVQTEKTTLESLTDEDIAFTNKIKLENNKIPTLSPMIANALDKIPSLVKLAEIHRENKNKNQIKLSESDENVGRMHLKDFLFGEYSLEEVIYQLAKTMFTQSLNNGSENSQASLQKLIQFLENEGKQGLISPMLEKKVLDVLLTALSDTLRENPEILKNTHLAINE